MNRFPLYLRFIIPISLIIILSSVIISWIIIDHEKARLKTNLQDKGTTLAEYLSLNSEYGVLTNNQESLQNLVRIVLKGKDVIYAEIKDTEGRVLARNDKKEDISESELMVITSPIFTQKVIRKKEEIGIFPEEGEKQLKKEAISGGKEGLFLEDEKKEVAETKTEKIGDVNIGLSLKEVNATIKKTGNTIIVVTCLSVLLLILIVGFLSRLITGPIKKLVVATKKIAEGNLTETVEIKSGDEIGDLATSFNRMVANLKLSIEHLHQTSDFSQAMIPSKDMDGLLYTILNRILQIKGITKGIIFLWDERNKSFLPKSFAGIDSEVKIKFQDNKFLKDLFSGEDKAIYELNTEAGVWAKILINLGINYLIPLKSKNRIIGIVALGSSSLIETFSEEEIDLLNTFAHIGAMAIENLKLLQIQTENEILKLELEFAHDIQMRLLPQEIPQIKGFDIFTLSLPAKEIGGDYYDFINLNGGNQLGISIADVAGKGVPAALYMAGSRSFLRAEAIKSIKPGEVLSRINGLLYEDMKGKTFVSMFYGIIDIPTKVLRFTNAGHISPMLYRKQGDKLVYLESHGFPLGIIHGTFYQDSNFHLMPDDLIIFYTDGLVEAMNAERELFGFHRLENVLINTSSMDIKSVIDKIMAEVSDFLKGENLMDDLTLVAMKVN
ncbi:MAG: SpoIIE family protein phosphatase [Nitrospirae bacterium]|nr:SpoIIE family protein phosphatase [Nitrospirota bacterium]